MTHVWDKISKLAEEIESTLNHSMSSRALENKNYNWYNKFYSSNYYRSAHVEIVDRRATHKVYILHVTVFPHYNDPSPIFGFDAVCGPNKITGAFLDFSNAGDKSHPMMQWFAKQTANTEWNKTRNLPDWANQIFSPAMVAAGNVQTEEEVDKLYALTMRVLHYYLANVGYSQESGMDFHMAQNRYCHYQKQNPHVVRSMVSMGEEESTIKRFVNELLFPETV
jgi:hypothetical protein